MALRVDDLTLALRGRPVLAGLNAAFNPGDMTIILGPNGAGKSTLMACLAGLRIPDAGRVTLDGHDVAALDPRERGRKIGLLPQRADIHWDLDVAALVALGRLPHRGRWGRQAESDQAAIERAMDAADITHLAGRNVQRLSGGEQGRVLLARVLAGEPQWLLADEPLASLDPAHQLDTLARLRDCAAQGAGVVVILHDLTLAARHADRVLLMKDGRLIADGPVATVMTPALLAEAYGIRVEIGHASGGGLVVTPIGRA